MCLCLSRIPSISSSRLRSSLSPPIVPLLFPPFPPPIHFLLPHPPTISSLTLSPFSHPPLSLFVLPHLLLTASSSSLLISPPPPLRIYTTSSPLLPPHLPTPPPLPPYPSSTPPPSPPPHWFFRSLDHYLKFLSLHCNNEERCLRRSVHCIVFCTFLWIEVTHEDTRLSHLLKGYLQSLTGQWTLQRSTKNWSISWRSANRYVRCCFFFLRRGSR